MNFSLVSACTKDRPNNNNTAQGYASVANCKWNASLHLENRCLCLCWNVMETKTVRDQFTIIQLNHWSIISFNCEWRIYDLVTPQPRHTGGWTMNSDKKPFVFSCFSNCAPSVWFHFPCQRKQKLFSQSRVRPNPISDLLAFGAESHRIAFNLDVSLENFLFHFGDAEDNCILKNKNKPQTAVRRRRRRRRRRVY